MFIFSDHVHIIQPTLFGCLEEAIEAGQYGVVVLLHHVVRQGGRPRLQCIHGHIG